MAFLRIKPSVSFITKSATDVDFTKEISKLIHYSVFDPSKTIPAQRQTDTDRDKTNRDRGRDSMNGHIIRFNQTHSAR